MTAFPDYDRFDALGLAEQVRLGAVTAEQLLEEAIQRLDRVDPILNSVITRLDDRAHERLGDQLNGPFAGVPFLLKDLLHTYRGVPTTCGSESLRDVVSPHDSTFVARCQAAGLVVFGKTNVPEFGLVAFTEPDAFGATLNPWDPTRNPGGSSGGSAAAVAAGVVPIASANDGGGSIRIPAAWCGLFGLKPSRGRVSAGPDYAQPWDGAVADLAVSRSVRDSAALLDAVAGPAPGDPYFLPPPRRPWLQEAETDPEPLRIALSTRSPLGTSVDPECVQAARRTADLLADLGHQVEEADAPVDGMAVMRAYLTLYYGSVAADLRRITADTGRDARKHVEPITRLAGEVGERISSAQFVESRRTWNDFGRAMGAFHQRYDLYLTPTTGALPPRVGALKVSAVEKLGVRLINRIGAAGLVMRTGTLEKIALEQLTPVPFTQLANLTGQPAMSVPLHWTGDGLPCGSHFMAPLAREDLLFRLAGQLERVQPWWDRRPKIWAATG